MIRVQGILNSAPNVLLGSALLVAVTSAFGQVSPSEVLNPRAQADEREYLPQLQTLQKEIGAASFPYSFRVARYLNAKPGQRAALDSNGIEFVYFQHRVVLKISGLYKAAFDGAQLSENERASRTLQDAVIPVLRLVAREIPHSVDCDGIGVEIVYNTRHADNSFEYEGREVLTAVFSLDDAFAFANATTDAERQELLNRADIFVNGKEYSLALGQREPLDLLARERSVPRNAVEMSSSIAAGLPHVALVSATAASPAVSVSHAVPVSESSSTSSDEPAVAAEYQAQTNAILKEDGPRFHLAEGTVPSLGVNGEHKLLHLTMRNTMSFERNTSSIYKRAAQSFDLFLAPELKDLLKELPSHGEFDSLDFSVLNHLGAEATSQETIEYICPMDSMRSFVENKITSQDLINKSTILVNGVRIGLDLQLVE